MKRPVPFFKVNGFSKTASAEMIAWVPRSCRTFGRNRAKKHPFTRILSLSQRLREADERIVKDEGPRSRARGHWSAANDETVVSSPYLASKSLWLQRQVPTPLELGDLPFVVGRRAVEGEGAPLWEPDLTLTDSMPFRLSRNHFIIELRDGDFHVRDLCSTLGTVVNGEPIGNHFPTDDALLRAGENEVVAGGMDSPFVFSVFIA
jgi:hypothetical protein